MNPEEQNFEQLRRLLALKRHEQPPPRYFDNFSVRVIARIQAGERTEEGLGILQQLPWLQPLWALCQQKPLLAGAFGVAVCSLLVGGVALFDTSPGTVDVPDSSSSRLPILAQVPDHPLGLSTPDHLDPEHGTLAGFSSTNGGILPPPARASLFNELPPLRAQPAAWHLPGGN